MKIDKSDFYYGAVILNLLTDKQKREIELLDTPQSHQFVKHSKDGITCIVFTKYQSSSQVISNTPSWNFTLTENELNNCNRIRSNHNYDRIDIVLICAETELQKSHLCIVSGQDAELFITERKAKVSLQEEGLTCQINNINIQLSTSFH